LEKESGLRQSNSFLETVIYEQRGLFASTSGFTFQMIDTAARWLAKISRWFLMHIALNNPFPSSIFRGNWKQMVSESNFYAKASSNSEFGKRSNLALAAIE